MGKLKNKNKIRLTIYLYKDCKFKRQAHDDKRCSAVDLFKILISCREKN